MKRESALQVILCRCFLRNAYADTESIAPHRGFAQLSFVNDVNACSKRSRSPRLSISSIRVHCDCAEDPEPPPPGDAAHEKGGNVAWGMMMFVMLGDMFGLGCLTLPANFAQLGWVVALALIALCALGMLYSGRLFTLLGILVSLHLPPSFI